MNVGGRERVVLDIIKHINKNEFDIHIVCIGKRGACYDQFVATGVPLHFFNKKKEQS